jgi:hypothetical protein
VKAIFEDQEKEMQKLFESSEGDPMAMRETMMKREREVDEKIASLLNAEQKQKFLELQKQRRKRFDEHRRDDQGEPPMPDPMSLQERAPMPGPMSPEEQPITA